MSGGGGYYTPSSFRMQDTCELLRFETFLIDIVDSKLAEVSINDELYVDIVNDEVCVFTKNGEILGKIQKQDIDKLKKCLNEKYIYLARVITLEDKKCQVQVHHQSL